MIRYVGTCPVCERQQKVAPGKAMVHHGYKRPGYGNIVGDCFGVGYPAYELSFEGCVAYQKYLVGWIADTERALKRYETRPLEITVSSVVHGRLGSRVVRRDSEDPKDRRDYESGLASEIRQTEYMLRDLRRSEKRMEELISSWRLAPLTEIDEEGLTQSDRDARVARKSEREQKRGEKDQKRAEFQAKSNARVVRRATTLIFFFDEFERLAKQQPSASRTAYARDLLFEASKKKYGVSYPWDLFRGPSHASGDGMLGPWGRSTATGAYQTLIDLGVAKPIEGRTDGYADVEGVYAPSRHGNKIRVPDPDPTKSTEELLDEIANRRLT